MDWPTKKPSPPCSGSSWQHQSPASRVHPGSGSNCCYRLRPSSTYQNYLRAGSAHSARFSLSQLTNHGWSSLQGGPSCLTLLQPAKHHQTLSSSSPSLGIFLPYLSYKMFSFTQAGSKIVRVPPGCQPPYKPLPVIQRHT